MALMAVAGCATSGLQSGPSGGPADGAANNPPTHLAVDLPLAPANVRGSRGAALSGGHIRVAYAGDAAGLFQNGIPSPVFEPSRPAEKAPFFDKERFRVLAQKADDAAAAAPAGDDAELSLGQIAQKANNPISDAWLLQRSRLSTQLMDEPASSSFWNKQRRFAQLRGGSASGTEPQPSEGAGPQPSEMDAIGEAMANPLSYLWLLFTQNDTIWYDGDIADALGEDAKVQNTYMLNPVLSFQLTDNWKTIVRPVIPINSFETVGNVDVSTTTPGDVTGVDFDRETGLGDIVLWTAFSNRYKPPFVLGFGPTLMFDTATEDQLGTGKFSAGPMGLAFAITEKWIIGTIAQHWWSYAGEDDISVDTSGGPVRVDRPDVNLTDVQPVIRYRLSPTTNIGMAPNWRYNWESDQLSLPLGLGGDTLVKIGKLPVKIGLEAYYYVERDDDFGPQFQIRFLFVPVMPSPEWSRRPLF